MYFPWLAIPSGAWLRHAALYWDGIYIVGDKSDASMLAKIRPEVGFLANEGYLKYIGIQSFFEIETKEMSMQRNRERNEILSSSRGIALRDSPAAETVRQRSLLELDLRRSRNKTQGKEATLPMLDDFSSDPQLVEMAIRVQGRAAKRLGVPVATARRFLVLHSLLWSALAVRDFCSVKAGTLEAGTDCLLLGELLYTPLPETHQEPALGISLMNVFPQPVPDAPIELVLQLKEKHRLEYLHFRQALREMKAEFSRATSMAESNRILAAFADELAARRLELARKMHRDGVGTVFSMVKAVINSAPSALMTGIGVQVLGQDLPVSLKVAALAAPPVIAVLQQGCASWRERREAIEESEAGYLFWADKMGLIGE
jgi:hypothetical protein